MRIGILDIDSEKKRDNRGEKRKYPNVACGKIYGYHKVKGDEVIYPWKGQKVDVLYISTIFAWTRPAIYRQMEFYKKQAKEVLIGGSGWDNYDPKNYNITKLPKEIAVFDDPKWLYEMYDIDYGIGFTTRGCHVNCWFCNVSKKEGIYEYQDTPFSKLINPKMKHLILMNNNSLAHDTFWEDVAEIKRRGISINWDQANDITLVTPRVAEALSGVNYRNFAGDDQELVFAFDLIRKPKSLILEKSSNNVVDALDLVKNGEDYYFKSGELLEMGKKYTNSYEDTRLVAKLVINPLDQKRETHLEVCFDMLKLVPRKIKLMEQHGIDPKHLKFYVLIGFNTTEKQDLARIEILHSFGCRPYPMLFRDLTGKPFVDGRGNKQSFHCRPFRDWVNRGLYKTVPFHEFDRFPLRKKQREADDKYEEFMSKQPIMNF